ncbi:uncharacterized protein Dmoj_GI19064 [Drosophila mojavensis]|uniref:DUF4794 domain-containing protein n=1 Tax=Drosophila mojavensis TaxID=7230 RepID=B4KRV0_DROMO|nr:uncharacterized protein Dmoj_GI19064 [Drosophila mojavensis]
MASKQLSLRILWLLFALSRQPNVLGQDEPDAQQLQALRPRGRVRIADMQMTAQQPPAPAMLGHGSVNWPGYAPIVPNVLPMPASSTVHTHIPLLREQPDSKAPSEQRGPDSVVYGNWKPELPQMPPEAGEEPPKQRKYGRLEAMLMGMPADATDRRDTSSEEMLPETEQRTAGVGYQNPYSRRDSFEHSQETRSRWRIPSQLHPSQLQPQPQPKQSAIEVVRVNATDPLMRAMAQQINESVETTTAVQRRKHVQTTEDNWMPLPYPYPTPTFESTQPVPRVSPGMSSTAAPTPSAGLVESTTVALNWPTDFLDATPSSTERIYTDAGSSIDRVDHIDSIDRLDDDIDDYKYYEENLNSAQMQSELSVPDTQVPQVPQGPQMPLNITRVGIPYEERNSAEEPTICVPLTVSEMATESSTAVLVEVERVYCFPLPKVEIKTGKVRQQFVPQATEQEPSSNANVTAVDMEHPQPEATAGASHPTSWALLLILWSYVLVHS